MAVKDYSTIYTIKDFFLNVIAPAYFEVDKLAQLNSGLLGMITDVSGTVTEDQFNTVDVYLNETMPGKENLPDFIYAKAAIYGVNDLLASAASMPFLLFIKEEDVIENGSWSNNVHTLRIDAGLKIYVDELVYSIPYDIVIRSTLYKDNYNHIAHYDISSKNDCAASIAVPYLRMLKTMSNGDEYLAIRVDAFQYIRYNYEVDIITNNRLNIPYIEETYTDQLCNFEVFYKETQDSVPVQLEKRLESALPTTTPFVYYKLTDENVVRFSFPTDDRYFIPEYNSKLIIYMYETNGSDGNFKQYSDADISVVPDTDNEEISYNRSIILFGMMRGDSYGGKSQKTLDEIKQYSLEKQITIDSFTTDNDLNTHFLTYAYVKKCDAIFVKYRDDVAGRIYGCFTKLNDGTDIYPTNTLNVRIEPDQVSQHFESLKQYIIKPGSRYGYASEGDKDTVVVLSEDDPTQRHEYTSVFLSVITIRPNSVNYYMNSVNKTVELSYTYMNANSIFNFITNNCTLKRNAVIGENSYHVSLDLSRVDGVVSKANITSDENITFDVDKLKVLMIFDTKEGHYVELKRVLPQSTELAEQGTASFYTFETYLNTDDMIDDDRISIENLVLRETKEVTSRIINMMNPGITFAVLYEYPDGYGDLFHDYNDIVDTTGYTLCNTYTPYEDEFYFAYPMTLMRSPVIFEDNPNNKAGFNFLIKRQSLFGYDFIMNSPDDIQDVVQMIISQHDFLMSTITEITANFTINIQFYNTYGKSKLFYLSDTDTNLNWTDCDCSFSIKFFDGIISDDYIDPIKQFIKTYIEATDPHNIGVNRIHVSELIQKLHNNFEQIEYIHFNHINSYDPSIQDIEMEDTLAEIAKPDTIPEFVTIKVSDVEITTI